MLVFKCCIHAYSSTQLSDGAPTPVCGTEQIISTLAYAHSSPNLPLEQWETIEEHSTKVAELAQRHAEKFDAGAFGQAAGLLHDLGRPEYRTEGLR